MASDLVFSTESFRNPGNKYRPLQIIHGFDSCAESVDSEAHTGSGHDGQEATRRAIRSFLDKLLRLGTGGIVANVGFRDYLVSPEQWDLLRYGLHAADEMGLRLWLYDEKGYPSGTAGGYVTRANPDLISLGLACYTVEAPSSPVVFALPASCRRFVWAGAARSLEKARHDHMLDLSSFVDEWDTLRWEPPASETWSIIYLAERIMYEGTHAAGNVCEFKHYINPLLPEATRAFIRLTHEAYCREIPPGLWQKIDAIFTDEPSLMASYTPILPERFWGNIPVVDQPIFADRPPAVPWRQDFLEHFRQAKGYELLLHLFELFYSESAEALAVRQDYYETVTQLYAEAYFEPIRDWCRTHGVDSAGHVLPEENIVDHAPFQGSLLTVLRRLDVPGIDMLNADPRRMLGDGTFMGAAFMAAKQASSAAHLAGRRRIFSESSDWEQRNDGRFTTLDERRGQGNLQFVLGVNLITSYFGWEEIGEEGWRQYNDYMGRLSSLLTGGVHVCRVAVLYPIRAVWAHTLPMYAPLPSWDAHMDQNRSPWIIGLAHAYQAMVRQLLCNQIDLDIVDEEALIGGRIDDGVLRVADEAYRVIILPPIDSLALEAGRALAAFARSGGLVLATGPLPTITGHMGVHEESDLIMAETFGAGGNGRMVRAEALPAAVRAALPPDFALATPNPHILYTHRFLEGRHLYFVVNMSPEPAEVQPSLSVAGPYRLYRPLDGSQTPVVGPATIRLSGYEGIFMVTLGD